MMVFIERYNSINHHYQSQQLNPGKGIFGPDLKEMNRDHHRVVVWLMIGMIMVFFQIILGGITRLTGSGLSITKWDIVTGAIPPLNEKDWTLAFQSYQATPQYQKINQGITLSQFKFIYFWEYVHRLWARAMGFVFLIPFLVFLTRGSLSKKTLARLALVIGFAALAAIFGWIMVASGLVNRPWVNAYKLTVHLSLGISLFISLFYTWIKERGLKRLEIPIGLKRILIIIFSLGIVQILLGGMMSGMKAALLFPTWPGMRGSFIPTILKMRNHWTTDDFLFYDQSGFMPALVQFLHRNTAYLILAFSVYWLLQWRKRLNTHELKYPLILLGIIVVQSAFGILTLINSVGSIPVFFGVVHQGIGILFLTYVFFGLLKTSPNLL